MKKPSLLILATLAIGGCGQKGPLYLPEHNEVVITSPVSPEATEARPQPLPAAPGAQGGATPGPPAAPGQAPGPAGQAAPQSSEQQSSSSSSPPAAPQQPR